MTALISISLTDRPEVKCFASSKYAIPDIGIEIIVTTRKYKKISRMN
jgi:hypothetical protein